MWRYGNNEVPQFEVRCHIVNPEAQEARMSGKQIAYTAIVALLVVVGYDRYQARG